MSEPPAPEIRHRTFISAPADRVYQLLSTGEGWDAWFTQGTAIDARPGGRISLRWVNFGVDHEDAEDGGPVLDAIPEKRLVFQWSPAGSPTTVSVSLQQLGDGTLVELVESGYRMVEDDIRILIRCAVGWGEALTLLKFYAESGATYGRVPPGSQPATSGEPNAPQHHGAAACSE